MQTVRWMRRTDQETELPPQRLQERLVRMMGRRPTRKMAYTGLKLLGVHIPPTVEIGERFRMPHGALGLVIEDWAIIGNNVKIFHGVTLGNADPRPPEHPATNSSVDRFIVEDDVVIGAGAKLMRKGGQTLRIGRGAVIGANAVVLSSVPPGEIWAGVPARKVSG